MGYGSYSFTDRTARSIDLGYHERSYNDVAAKKMQQCMSPMKVGIRESRDSDEHPISVPVLIGLDLTGSMGSVPQMFIRDGLPTMIQKIIDAGIPHPQVLFVGVGDHECDQAPLQIGQYETSDELMDQWLTQVWPEGNGGGNDGESYLLAWYFAAMHTAHDNMDKRNLKGFLFTIGDEPNLRTLPARDIKAITGDDVERDYTDLELLEMAKEKYHVYHIHLMKTGGWGDNNRPIDVWRENLGENLIVLEDHTTVPTTIANIVNSKSITDLREKLDSVDQ